jgi:spore germination protein KB
MPQLDFQQLKPVLYYGWRPVLVGSIVPTALFFETIFVLHLLPMVKDNKGTRKLPFIGIIFSGLMLVLLVIMLIAIFGPVEAEQLQFPFYSLAREVTIGDFIERVEALIVVVWLTNLFISITLMLYMAREMLVQISKRLQQYNQYINVGLIVMLGILGSRLFANTVDISNFYHPMQYGLIGFLVPGLIPIIMYIVMLIRKQGVK